MAGYSRVGPLIKLIFPLLLAIYTLTAQAREPLPLSDITIVNARNIKISLLADDTLNKSGLWERIRTGFTMRNVDGPLVAKHEQWYASRPDYMGRMVVRANRYLYYITCEVERRGMPSEIALLPMIESAFNPGANSTSSAAGIWQFMPATGKNFGMRQNWWYDGRRDIIGATTGALDYLEKLHTMFGDWELALAAYNWGEGSIQRAQARNRKKGLPVDYASLTLPDETRNYLPKLMAIRNIVANPERYGLSLADIANQPYFTSVPTEKHIDVELAAQLAEIPVEEFIALNPAHNRPVILQGNSNYILLPAEKVETYQANMRSYDMPLVSWKIYRTKKGEQLTHLAPRFGLTLERLKSVNSLSARADLSDGDTLLVPVSGEQEETEFEAVDMHLHPVARAQPGTASLKYTVHKGDTLDKLAARYHVSVASLRNWNGHLTQVKTGQTLNIVQSSEKKPSRALSVKHKTIARISHRAKATASKAPRVRLAYQKNTRG